uniref:NADH dehydrogenase subunit 5 n=1 Tax=Megalocaria dilatata TaxID=511882 RepID=UPI002079E715|nr:NADH dehydrogenase subunit 5 [Megalocaria dilatata]URN72803.1 NADH dehydrogenase subunit 5 [Megalocaria dilatata]
MLILNLYLIMLFMLFISMLIMSFYLMFMDKVFFIEFNLFNLNSLSIEYLLFFDWMSSLFMSFVLLISSMVIYYSNKYMAEDLNIIRFNMLVLLFVFSMMLMIMSPNLISILLGWDGLGLVSYCLVIYYQNLKSYSAGMLTALSNRIGDVALLMAIAWMMNYGSWNFLIYLEYYNLDMNLKIVGFLILIAAFTKSAQMPFSSWLPAAMAAPTPVSALVHSSTLVTAGVYLLIRFHFLMMDFTKIVLFIGLMTMFMSGLSANFEYDLKKIIALSTLSQLGLMFTILGLGSFELAFFHLLIHALFKALLFMCAGNFIHLMGNCQDIRYMGSLIYKIPTTIVYFNVSNLSLCGMPFFSGFYSKDLIMEFYSMGNLSLFMYTMMYLSLGFTVSYTFRLIYYLMYSDMNLFSLNSIKEEFDSMLYSMTLMFIIVVFSGSMLMWMLFKNPYLIILPFFMKIFTLLMIMLGAMIGLEISKFSLTYNFMFNYNFKQLTFFSSMWYLPNISTLGINYFFLFMGKNNLKYFDQGWLEYYGSQGLFYYLKNSSVLLQYLFKNNLKIFLIMVMGWIFILLILNF